MVRNRERKTDKGSFSEDDMRQAVLLVQQGMSIRKAAKEKGLKYPTLSRYVKKSKSVNVGEVIAMRPNYECRRVFTDYQEEELKTYLIMSSKIFYGLTPKDCRQLAYEMANINSIPCPKSWEENKLAGIDWYLNFMQRHPQLSSRTPEGCSLSRATSFNRVNVDEFYDNLMNILSKHPEFADGTRIFNLDETATSTVQRPQKVIAEKGVKQVSKCTSAEKGTTVTTCCIISASGNTIPPVMIFPRVHFKSHMVKDAPTGTLGLATPSGWMTRELFVEVMKHFIHHTRSSKESPSLLLFDNHDSHLSIEVIELARNNGVTILTFPPHCTNKLQPLDVAVYKSFKSFYNAAVDSWMLQHPGQTLSIYDIAGIVNIAHQRALTPSNIMSGFKKCGIFPFDRCVFTEDDFLCSFVTDRPMPQETGSLSTDSSNLEKASHSHAGETTCNGATANETSSETRFADSSNLDNAPHSHASEKMSRSETLTQTNECSPIVPSSSSTVSSTLFPTTKTFVSPTEFKGFPKAGERKQKNAQRKRRSIIATSTPEKNAIIARKRSSKTTNARKSLFRRKVVDSDDGDENDTEMVFDDSDNDEDFINEMLESINPEDFEDLEKEPVGGDYVLVKYAITGKKDVFYVGQVMGPKDAKGEFDVVFLRKSNKMMNRFVKPEIEDRASVRESQIKIILPKPIAYGQTKRQNCYLSFGIDFSHVNLK